MNKLKGNLTEIKHEKVKQKYCSYDNSKSDFKAVFVTYTYIHTYTTTYPYIYLYINKFKFKNQILKQVYLNNPYTKEKVTILKSK